jgi:hypothetical protein
MSQPSPTPLQRNALDDAFGHWLAGFIDGEGSFGIQGLSGHTGPAIDPYSTLPDLEVSTLLSSKWTPFEDADKTRKIARAVDLPHSRWVAPFSRLGPNDTNARSSSYLFENRQVVIPQL